MSRLGSRSDKAARARAGSVLCVALGLWTHALWAASFPVPAYEQVVPGVWYAHAERKSPPLRFHVVKAELGTGGVAIAPLQATGRERLADTVQRLAASGRAPVAAINGDYFHRRTMHGGPWGVHAEDGELFFSPTEKSALLIDAQGVPSVALPRLRMSIEFEGHPRRYRVAHVNRPATPRLEPGFRVFTRRYDRPNVALTRGLGIVVKAAGPLTLGRENRGTILGLIRTSKVIPVQDGQWILTCVPAVAARCGDLKIGSAITISGQLEPAAHQAIGGGPRMIRAGKVNIEFDRENFSKGHTSYISRSRHPRAGAGVSQDGKTVWFLAVEGRSAESGGLNMEEFARLMRHLGAWDALSFDGGHSTDIFAKGKNREVQHPGKAKIKGRHLVNALGFFLKGNARPQAAQARE